MTQFVYLGRKLTEILTSGVERSLKKNYEEKEKKEMTG